MKVNFPWVRLRTITICAALFLLNQPARACLNSESDTESITGKLIALSSSENTENSPKRFVVELEEAQCLDHLDPEMNVESSSTVQIIIEDEQLQNTIEGLAGQTVTIKGRPFAARTREHIAPIILQAIELRINVRD